MLVNRYFFAVDPDSRISRRIHLVFAQSPRLRLESEQRKPFFLASLLTQQALGSVLGEAGNGRTVGQGA